MTSTGHIERAGTAHGGRWPGCHHSQCPAFVVLPTGAVLPHSSSWTWARAELGAGMSDVVLARFRPSPSVVLPVVGVLVLVALLLPSPGRWWFVLGFSVLLGLLRGRQGLVCTEDGVAVTVIGTRHVPWSDIRGFRPGRRLRGGLVIGTDSGMVWSTAPCSWWGGPACPVDLAWLEALRVQRAPGQTGHDDPDPGRAG